VQRIIIKDDILVKVITNCSAYPLCSSLDM